MDFEGEVDGTPFEGGKGEDMQVELGSGRLIPGFEDQLVGAKAGDSREVKVTFPDDYPAENLKGKAATFAVTVKAVKTAGEQKIDDDFAKSLGLTDLDQLKGLIRGQQEQELNGLTRTHMKRQLLDQLAARHDFPVPDIDGRGRVSEHHRSSFATKRAMRKTRRRRWPRSRPKPTNIARSPSAASASACCCRKSAPPTASMSPSRR